MTELILNEEIHQRAILDLVPEAKKFLWIVTADIKDLHVKKGRRYVPFLEILSDLILSGVAVRLFHAKEPGPRFREDFDRQGHYCRRSQSVHRLCQSHWSWSGCQIPFTTKF